jgi:hypothetical protein
MASPEHVTEKKIPSLDSHGRVPNGRLFITLLHYVGNADRTHADISLGDFRAVLQRHGYPDDVIDRTFTDFHYMDEHFDHAVAGAREKIAKRYLRGQAAISLLPDSARKREETKQEAQINPKTIATQLTARRRGKILAERIAQAEPMPAAPSAAVYEPELSEKPDTGNKNEKSISASPQERSGSKRSARVLRKKTGGRIARNNKVYESPRVEQFLLDSTLTGDGTINHGMFTRLLVNMARKRKRKGHGALLSRSAIRKYLKDYGYPELVVERTIIANRDQWRELKAEAIRLAREKGRRGTPRRRLTADVSYSTDSQRVPLREIVAAKFQPINVEHVVVHSTRTDDPPRSALSSADTRTRYIDDEPSMQKGFAQTDRTARRHSKPPRIIWPPSYTTYIHPIRYHDYPQTRYFFTPLALLRRRAPDDDLTKPPETPAQQVTVHLIDPADGDIRSTDFTDHKQIRLIQLLDEAGGILQPTSRLASSLGISPVETGQLFVDMNRTATQEIGTQLAIKVKRSKSSGRRTPINKWRLNPELTVSVKK